MSVNIVFESVLFPFVTESDSFKSIVRAAAVLKEYYIELVLSESCG
jgi:hypothetical protein